MDFSSLSNMIAENNLLIGSFLVIGFLIWFYIVRPNINKDEPIPKTPGNESEE